MTFGVNPDWHENPISDNKAHCVPWYAEPRRAAATLLLVSFCVRIPFLFVTKNINGDAWFRYQIALQWSQHPFEVPSVVWLPMHFWILGLALKVWHSVCMARIVTLLFGALTVLPFWGIVKRLFDIRVAFYSTLAFAILGVHVGYSVVTSSEAPTVLLLIIGLYSWIRYRRAEKYSWAVLAGLALSAACLFRYEPWVALITLAGLSLRRLDVAPFPRPRRGPLIAFLVLASTGSIGWCTFSYVKWHDPFKSAHETIVLNKNDRTTNETYKSVVVPGAIGACLGPVLVPLALFGIGHTFARASSLKVTLSILAIMLAGAHYINAVLHAVTQARYTLMYVWLLLPLAFEGLYVCLRQRTPSWNRKGFVIVIVSFLLWQAGITITAQFGPCVIGDRLAQLSPTLPRRCDLRHLMAWMNRNARPNESVVIDSFNYEDRVIAQFLEPAPAMVFRASRQASDPAALERTIAEFVKQQHPRLLVYSPRGELARIWPLSDNEEVDVVSSELELRLKRLWQDGNYRVYEIEYRAERETDPVYK